MKKFDDQIIKRASFNYNENENVGKLIVEYQSGINYHYENVNLYSVNALFNNNEKYIFTAHNKYIHSKYPKFKTVYTQKWKTTTEKARREQYLAKSNAARRIRKQKLRESEAAKSQIQ
jgi:hypothetical protein